MFAFIMELETSPFVLIHSLAHRRENYLEIETVLRTNVEHGESRIIVFQMGPFKFQKGLYQVFSQSVLVLKNNICAVMIEYSNGESPLP